MRKTRRGDDGRIGDVHRVMQLVALLQAAQDGHAALDVRLVHQHLLEASLQGGILLDVLAVLVEGGGAHAVQLAARQRRLEHVAGVHGAFGLAGPHHRVQLVDEQDDGTALLAQFVQHGLQALLELAAELRPSDQRPHVQRQDALVLQAFRHLAVENALRQALDDGRLAHARFADQHRIVLGAPLQHLHGAADFIVAPDHRIELALLRPRREVDGVLGERLAGLFGVGVAHRLAATCAFDGRSKALGSEPSLAQRRAGRIVRSAKGRQSQLRRHEIVAALLRLAVGQIHDAAQRRRHSHVAGWPPDARQSVQPRIHAARQPLPIHARRRKQGIDAAVFQQRGKQVQRGHRRMVAPNRQRLGGGKRSLQARGESFDPHGGSVQDGVAR